jgi:hypothetical protein
MHEIARHIFDALPEARYVALYVAGELQMDQRPSLLNASAHESDRYEELLVNPTLLKLLTQRGEIDCGGFEYVVVRYGNFYQFIAPVHEGHISVALEPIAGIDGCVERLRSVIGSTLAA